MAKALEAGAATLGIRLEILRASSDPEIDAVMGTLQSTANVMVSGTDALFFVRRSRIATLAMRQSLPTIFDDRENATAGALASYGADFLNVMELAGEYTGRVLKGQKPADLPAVQAAKFEFVINRKTATALGIGIPPMLLALADEVIE
jgi:putative ABC transport system substrate-binding protein